MNTKLNIRKLELNDYNKGYLNLLKVLYDDHVSNFTFEQFKEIYNNISKNENHYILVLEKDKKIIGTASILLEPKFCRNGKKVGHIEDVMVDKNYRRKKIGYNLVKECIKIGKENNCYKIILRSLKENFNFYFKNNFEFVDDVHNFMIYF